MSTGWDGIYCALWTPTDKSGELIESALAENVAFLKTRGLQGLLVLGSTGEFLHLEPGLRQRLVEQVIHMAGPLRIIVNLSDVRPRVVMDLAQFAKQVGAPAVSLLPPSFYPVAPEDQAEFFVRAASAANLPLFLYNFPERTGNRISLETVAAVADRVRVEGIKQSGAEFSYHAPLVELGRKKGFIVYTGADTRLPEAVSAGVAGCVSGLANAVPELVVQSFCGAREGGSVDGQIAATRLTELSKRIPVVTFPLDVAACMQARGLETGSPKAILSSETRKRFDRLVAELRELFREWKLI